MTKPTLTLPDRIIETIADENTEMVFGPGRWLGMRCLDSVIADCEKVHRTKSVHPYISPLVAWERVIFPWRLNQFLRPQKATNFQKEQAMSYVAQYIREAV